MKERKLTYFSIILLISLILCVNGVSAVSTQRYVSSTGGDDGTEVPNDCSSISPPCLTIQHAIDMASEGDIINVGAGSYTENVNVNKPLDLQGASSSSVTVTAASSSNNAITITANSVNISGFTITGANVATTAGIYINNNVAFCDISNNILTNNGDGIWLGSGSNHNTFTSNTLSSNYQGFEIYISNYNTFTDNNASLNNNYGFKIDSGDYNTFINNIANSNTKYGFYVVTGDGGGATNSIFTNNTANSNIEYGIRMNGGDSNTLTNNTFNLNSVSSIRLKDDITNLRLNGNKFTNSQIGIDIVDVDDVSTWTLTNNKISGNTNTDVSNLGVGTLIATNNYWGSAVNATIKSKISGDVSYEPYWLNEEMTLPSTLVAVFDGIHSTLEGNDIANNIDECSAHPNVCSNLYFEKSIEGVKKGKITFNDDLDLTNSETRTFLENLGTKMDANTVGTISLDFRNTTSSLSLKDVSAEIKFYGLNESGFNASSTSVDVNSKLIAYDDNGILLDKSELISGDGTYLGACEVGGGCYTFTINVNHFTKYQIDTTAPTATMSYSPDNSAWTKQNVIATLHPSEDVTINNNGGSVNYNFSDNGEFIFSFTDSAGNIGTKTASVTWIDKTAPTITGLSNKEIKEGESFSQTFNVSDLSSGIGLVQVDNLGNFSVSNLSAGIYNLSDKSLNLLTGTYNLAITATDNLGNQKITTIVLTVLKDGQEGATEEETIVDESTTEIVFNQGSSNVKEIVINSSVNASTIISLDLTALQNSSGSVELSTNNLSLTRESGINNYTAEIPKGTIITGNSSWDGKITLPIVKSNSDYSVGGGSINVVIELGAGSELNFSQAVKVVLGGQTGKKAGWARGTGAITDIATKCVSATDYSNIDATTTRECYFDDGTDLIIWTYHFTSFASYTTSTASVATTGGSSGGGSSGGCSTTWECSEWSSCMDGTQTRTCSKKVSFCSAPIKDKPIETQTCVVEIEEKEGIAGAVAGITGAITGAATGVKENAKFGGIIVLIIIGVGLLVIIKRTKFSKNEQNEFTKDFDKEFD